MNQAILKQVRRHKSEGGEEHGYCEFVSGRSGRLVASLFVREPSAWDTLVGQPFDIVATLKGQSFG